MSQVVAWELTTEDVLVGGYRVIETVETYFPEDDESQSYVDVYCLDQSGEWEVFRVGSYDMVDVEDFLDLETVAKMCGLTWDKLFAHMVEDGTFIEHPNGGYFVNPLHEDGFTHRPE